MKTKRDLTIDNIKALAIIAMVVGHYNLSSGPKFFIAAYPVAFRGIIWGVVYVVFCVGGALLLNDLRLKLGEMVMKRMAHDLG